MTTTDSARTYSLSRRLQFLRTAVHDTVHHTVRLWTLIAVGHELARDPVRTDIAAMCRVVRVRMCLTLAQQAAFDQIVADYPRIMLGLFVDRSDADALDAIQRHLASVSLTMPPPLPPCDEA